MNDELHRAVLSVLLDHVEEDTYPSGTMMDQLEASLDGDQEMRARYVEALIEKIAADRFPSPTLIARTLRMVR